MQDLVNGERVQRERADAACRADLDQKIIELRTSFEQKAMQTDAEQTAELDRIRRALVMFEQKMENIEREGVMRVEEYDSKQARHMMETAALTHARIDDMGHQVEKKAHVLSMMCGEVQKAVTKENMERKKAVFAIEQAIEKEHLSRGQDESAIILLVDAFMRQMRAQQMASE